MKLINKINAVNYLNSCVKKIFEYEQDFYSQFIGMDILKNDLSFKKKYEHEKLKFDDEKNDTGNYTCQYFFTTSNYSISLKVRVCHHGGSYDNGTYFCTYEEANIYLFNLKYGLIVEKLLLDRYYSNSYTSQEIETYLDNINQAKKTYVDACNKMPHRFKDFYSIKSLY